MSVDRKNVVFGRMQYVHNDYPDYVGMAVAPIDENMVAVVFVQALLGAKKWLLNFLI